MALFSAFCRALLPLLMTPLRRIQNLASFGRLGAGNVSPVTIFGLLADLEQSILVTLDHRKVKFSAFIRAIRPLLMMLLRSIQNISPFGRWGVRNVSHAWIF